jgi:hypothetical protein
VIGRLAAAVLALSHLSLVHAAPPLPPMLSAGGQELRLVSCGVREVLWVEIYSAGLYLRPGARADAAADAAEPAALAVRVQSAMHFPYHMPDKWRHALASGLDDAAMRRVERAYHALQDDDLLTVRYAPGAGVKLELNGRPIVQTGDHRIIRALLEAWAEDQPIEDKIRRIALDHPCGT